MHTHTHLEILLFRKYTKKLHFGTELPKLLKFNHQKGTSKENKDLKTFSFYHVNGNKIIVQTLEN